MRSRSYVPAALLLVLGAAYGDSPASDRDKILGNWSLQSYLIKDKDGSQISWCDGSLTGLLMYERDGMMSIAVNCSGSTEKSPSRTVRDILFYTGSYDFDGKTVIHHVKNSARTDFIGTDLVRQVLPTDDSMLILSGPVAVAPGGTFFLTWKKYSK